MPVRAPSAEPSPPRPLVITSDQELLDQVLHLAAAAGVNVLVAPDLPAASASASARCVVLGADVAESAARSRLPAQPVTIVAGLEPVVAATRTAAAGLGATLAVLPADQDVLVACLLSAAEPAAGGAVVAVVGGRGGAGASVLACALALTATAASQRVVLVDADPLGGGLDLTLGGEEQPGLRWPDLESLHGPVASQVLVESLPVVHGVTLLSHSRAAGRAVPAPAMSAALDALVRGHDLVVVDLSRHADPATETALTYTDLTVLVLPAEVRATASARMVAASVGPVAADLRVVVRGPSPSGLTGRVVAGALGLPLAAWLRPEPGLAGALERGEPPARSGRGPLANVSRGLLRDLGDTVGGRRWTAA